MSRILKRVGLYVVLLVCAVALSRLVLYLRVLDASALDTPIAMNVRLLEDRDSLNPNTVAHLKNVRIDSEEVITCLFDEIRAATLHGTRPANPFERYPVYLMILEYDEGAQDTFMYIEVAADRRITVNIDGKTAYYGYISQATYDLLSAAYHDS
ncbi:MAG: hypothetical protein ACOX5M_05270 [Bacillota bacterium]